MNALPSTTAAHHASNYAQLSWRGRALALEYAWVGAQQSTQSTKPVLVFLHEGLGSLALWKDFPERLCAMLGLRGLVFSRYGYGNSTPRPATESWPLDFMQIQAREVLPLLLQHLGIESPWLFGHSDGASIALLHAAYYPQHVSGVIAVAPHIMVEDVTIANIRIARSMYLEQDLRAKISRYHADVDSAFWGWNDVWLDPAFRAFNIEAELSRITCPLLAIQGEQDEYGTLQQIRGIQEKRPATRLVVLPQCGHSPHRDQPQAVMQAATHFMSNITSTHIVN